MSNNMRIKFKRDDDKQLALGVQVLVSAYNSKSKYRSKAIAKALRKLDIRDAALLPKPEALSFHLDILNKAMNDQKRPEEDSHGWQIVVQRAYDELTKKQVSVNDIEPAGEVTVPDVDDQENLMEQDAEQARKEEEPIPFTDLQVPEDFDIWQSDAYSFLTAFCNYCPDGDGTVTMSLKAFEMLFRRQYGRRNIA